MISPAVYEKTRALGFKDVESATKLSSANLTRGVLVFQRSNLSVSREAAHPSAGVDRKRGRLRSEVVGERDVACGRPHTKMIPSTPRPSTLLSVINAAQCHQRCAVSSTLRSVINAAQCHQRCSVSSTLLSVLDAHQCPSQQHALQTAPEKHSTRKDTLPASDATNPQTSRHVACMLGCCRRPTAQKKRRRRLETELIRHSERH
eukprot:988726-Rhodomonas_salina.2